MNKLNNEMGFEKLVGLFEQTQIAMQTQAARSVDIALVVRNWLFGWYIVEFENGGAERSELYGKKLLSKLSIKLKQSGLKGVSTTNLKQFRLFYETYKEIGQALPDQSLSAIISRDNITQLLSMPHLCSTKEIRQAVPAKSQEHSRLFVNLINRHVKTEEENPTVGILMCLSKSDKLVKLTLPENPNIYASQYQLYLPSKEDLKKQLEEAQQEWKAQQEK